MNVQLSLCDGKHGQKSQRSLSLAAMWTPATKAASRHLNAITATAERNSSGKSDLPGAHTYTAPQPFRPHCEHRLWAHTWSSCGSGAGPTCVDLLLWIKESNKCCIITEPDAFTSSSICTNDNLLHQSAAAATRPSHCSQPRPITMKLHLGFPGASTDRKSAAH